MPKRLIRQGATGLIEALSVDYLSTLSEKRSIEWICNHSRNTQLALLYGAIDLALTYERDQERVAASEGWSSTVGCAFHDHFVLAGPASDPAGLLSTTSLEDAFTKIAKSKALFHSRADASATMWKERSIWSICNLTPWTDRTASCWYKISLHSPAEALTTADAAGAYLLTDRSTLLRQTALQSIKNTTVFYEPTKADDILMNSCYALTATAASRSQATRVSQFIEYMLSERGQNVIANFGRDELGGYSLFASMRERYAKTCLRGGVARDGQWTSLAGSVPRSLQVSVGTDDQRKAHL